MPSKQAHVAAAIENQKAIEFLCGRLEDFPGWVATIAFYKALHIVEALLAGDPAIGDGHTDDHKARNHLLKSTNRYKHIWKNYFPLWQASLVARYLRDDDGGVDCEVFSRFMPPEVVRRLLLGHHLHQIECTVANLLGDPNFLQTGPNQG